MRRMKMWETNSVYSVKSELGKQNQGQGEIKSRKVKTANKANFCSPVNYGY